MRLALVNCFCHKVMFCFSTKDFTFALLFEGKVKFPDFAAACHIDDKLPAKIKKGAKIIQCGRGEIGRRTRLRIWRREAWGFESLRPDSLKSL